MLNTIAIKKPEIKLKQPSHLENIEGIIKENGNNNWSQEERSNLLQKNDNILNNTNNNILQGLHNTIKHNNTPIITQNNTMINQNRTMISFSKKSQKISIYDENKNIVGFFTLAHIIKYLGNIYDTERQFMTDINLDNFKSSKDLIKTFLFKIDYNKNTKKSDIILRDYTESGLMGDVSLLCQLNNLLYEYQEKQLYNDLAHVVDHNKIKIEQNIKRFIYLLLNYTIRLIFIISEKIKGKKDMDHIKNILLKCAIICSHRINTFVQEQLSVIYICDKEIKKAYVTNIDIKNVLKKRLEELTKEVVNEYRSERVVFNESDAFKI
jgi:hypothetical protein